MKFCIIWKEDKSQQNNSIKSVWNSSAQMTLSDKYDFEEYSPSFWILKQNPWSKMRYAVDNFEMKRIRHLHISHNTPCLPPSFPAPPFKQKYCITFVFNFFWVLQLSQEKLKTILMQNLGSKQGELYLRRCGIGDHPLCPRVFSFSNMAVTGRTENPHYYVAR